MAVSADTRPVAIEPSAIADPAPIALAGFVLSAFPPSGHSAACISNLMGIGPALV